jgi:hypothetical protein
MTAVQWLVEQLEKQIDKSAKNELGTNRGSDYRIGLRKAIDFCDEAKEMEKQQIIDAYVNGDIDAGIYAATKKNAEQYYKETFNLSQQDKP